MEDVLIWIWERWHIINTLLIIFLFLEMRLSLRKDIETSRDDTMKFIGTKFGESKAEIATQVRTLSDKIGKIKE